MQKLIPVDELLQIVTDAGLLHQRAFYETSLSKLIANGNDPLTELSTAYEVGAALGIPEERIRAVLALRYPEPEEQLALLEAHWAARGSVDTFLRCSFGLGGTTWVHDGGSVGSLRSRQ